MLFVPLPTVTGGVFTQRSKLDDVDYLLRFSHWTRTDDWTLDLSAIGSQTDADPVMTGQKLFIGFDLLRYCSHPQSPRGRLFLLRFDKTRRHPTAEDLSACRLVYLAKGEEFGEP